MKWKAVGAIVELPDGESFICGDHTHASFAAKRHNDEMEKIEKTIHRIAESVTKNAGAIQNRIGELERIKHVKHH